MKIKVVLAATAVFAGFIGAQSLSIATAPKAKACVVRSVIVMGNGGGWCDDPPYADGTWNHCEEAYAVGFGGVNCFRVRPVPTDVDPRGWTPA